MVAEAKNRQAFYREHFIPNSIILLLLKVTFAVYLDYHTGRVAVKVNDIPLNDLLTPKMQSIQTIPTQVLPDDCLFRRHFMPHQPGTLAHGIADITTTHDISHHNTLTPLLADIWY